MSEFINTAAASEPKISHNLIFTCPKAFERGMSSSSSTTTTEEWLLELLAGFRFNPDEGQMVSLLKKKTEGKASKACRFKPGIESVSFFLRFLKKMMQGLDSPSCQFIPEIEVCNYEPWHLRELLFPDNPYKPKAWYSFSRLDHKSIGSPRCNRSTKQGFWKSTGKPRVIESEQPANSVTCMKRTLTFHKGRVSNSEKTGWVMHEYELFKSGPGNKTNQQRDFVLCRLKNKSPDHQSDDKNLNGSSICDELADSGATNHMLPGEEQQPEYQEIEHVSLGSGNHDDDELGGCVSSGLYDQSVVDMIQELSAQPGEYVYPPFPPPEPPRLDHQLPQMGNVPDVYTTEYSNWPSPVGDYDPYLTNEWPPLVDSQLEETLGSNFDPFQPQNYSLPSPILYSEQGDLLHANNYIGCNESQSQYPEFATLFP